MPTFDVVSKIDWQEVDNAKNQALKEVTQRFDFKGVKCELDVSEKDKELKLSSSDEGKMGAFVEVLRNKLAKRDLSLFAFDFGKQEPAGAGGARVTIKVQAGLDKDNAKKITKAIKENKFKAQAQIQGEQVRVTSKKRDELQEVITFLKEEQSKLKVPLQFENFRD
mgnify:CR=1 FL=1